MSKKTISTGGTNGPYTITTNTTTNPSSPTIFIPQGTNVTQVLPGNILTTSGTGTAHWYNPHVPEEGVYHPHLTKTTSGTFVFIEEWNSSSFWSVSISMPDSTIRHYLGVIYED